MLYSQGRKTGRKPECKPSESESVPLKEGFCNHCLLWDYQFLAKPKSAAKREWSIFEARTHLEAHCDQLSEETFIQVRDCEY